MELFIPTYKRIWSDTWASLPQILRDRTRFVHNYGEPPMIGGEKDIVCPEYISGIGKVRQYIADLVDGPFIMMDDDLVFATRRDDDTTKFREATHNEIVAAFEELWEALCENYTHVGMASREGGNRLPIRRSYNTRLLRVLGYRSDILKREGIRFDIMKVMEDFDVALSLLTRGYPSMQLNWMVHNQKSSNAPGGCSMYRTLDIQREAAEELRARYPSFVNTVVKKTKTAWNGQERTDVRVQWKKAFESAGILRFAPVLGTGEIQNIPAEGGGVSETVVK